MTNHVSKRYNKDKLFKLYCVSAISLSILFLIILIGSIIYTSIPSFFSYKINLIPEEIVRIEDKNKYLNDIFLGNNSKFNILSINYEQEIKEGERWLSSSGKLSSALFKKDFSIFVPEEQKLIQQLIKQNKIKKYFNFSFFTNKESREPELAGIKTSLFGTIYTIFVCLIISIPLSVGAAIYLEEFAPKNIFTSLIEVNIINLAAVPSIVFGLLGLAVLINIFDIARSSSLVGGITLAMMVIPTMIISTREAVRVIPNSIKQAALALGATKTQMILHHTLPIALPGIMTGVILATSRAIGETAPLMMVGMLAFIVDIPHTILDPATTIPVQIFLWADSPELGFQSKTSAAILFLIFILVMINRIAVYIRNKYEKRW